MKNIILISITLFFVMSCSFDNDENQILLEYIKIEQKSDLMYPKFSNDIKHYTLDVQESSKLLIKSVDSQSEIIIDGESQGFGNIEYDITGYNFEDTLVIQIKNSNSLTKFYIHCINNEIPKIQIKELKNNVDNGHVLLSSKYINGRNSPYSILFIIDNNGVPILRKKILTAVTDFKQHNNGMYSYASRKKTKNSFGFWENEIVILDERFNEINRVETKGLTHTDNHDFIITNEGTYLFMSYDSNYRDFTEYGLSSNELTRDSVIQEISLSGNIVFEWNSWDHMNILDCLNHRFPDDYAHINSFYIDEDDNIIASFRGCSTILKINRITGNIMWSLGGSNPSLKIIGDPYNEFCGQHTASTYSDGSLTIFDNGGHCNGDRESQNGQFSRALEYKIDETNETATFNNHYILQNNMDFYSKSGGSFYKTRNGNWLVNWASGVDHGITEIDPSINEIVFNIEISNNDEIINNYRAYRIYEFTLPINSKNNLEYLYFNN